MPLNAQGKETGWISKWAFQAGALAADAIGRAAIAAGYFAATAAMRAKFADGFLTEAKLAVAGVDGLHPRRIARATYDFAEHGGAVSVIGLGVTLPDNTIVTRAWYEVLTTCHSPATPDAATISISIPVDDVDGILAAIAINDGTDPWDAGLFEAIQDGTAANFSIKTTAAREISVEIAVEPLDAGKFVVFLEYVVSD